MPTYEYACRSCQEHFEVVQSFKDDPLTACPSCPGELRKVFSAAGIIFKGSGWHIKDYASSSSPSGASGGSDTSKGEASSDTKGESKGTATSDKKPAGGSAASTTSTSSSGSSGERKSA